MPLLSTLPKPIPVRSRKRRLTKWLVFVGLILLAAAGAEAWRSHSQAHVKFETVSLGYGSIEANVTATGTLNPVVDGQVGSQFQETSRPYMPTSTPRLNKASWWL
jgi:multidrug efflux pump subunit AcrA (membrane-fusion protein)